MERPFLKELLGNDYGSCLNGSAGSCGDFDFM